MLVRVAFRSSFVAKMAQNIERAQRIQHKVIQNQYTIENEARIRQRVSIQSSIQHLEKEMRQEIARSLKTSENKVVYFIQKAEQRLKELNNRNLKQSQIDQYNHLIDQCEKARWEFLVHRHAVGFTIKNYELVTTLYKIPPKWV